MYIYLLWGFIVLFVFNCLIVNKIKKKKKLWIMNNVNIYWLLIIGVEKINDEILF